MTDDQLTRYVDGELDGAGVAAVEAAMAANPAVRAAVRQHQALRDAAAAAFEDVLTEPVPRHLISTLQPKGTVTDIAAARQRRDGRLAFVQRWGALAAMLVAGLLAGRELAPGTQALAGDAGLVRSLDGGKAQAIAIGLSYRNRAGHYCRLFRDDRAAPSAGIACRSADGWAIQVVAAAGPKQPDTYRTAAGDLPPAVTATLDATIAGAPLDAAGEATASRHGWR